MNLLPSIKFRRPASWTCFFLELMLWTAAFLFILGHCLSWSPPKLDPINNFISQYAVSSRAAILFQITIILFGAVFAVLAFRLMDPAHSHSKIVRIACLCLAAASLAMILVAMYPTVPLDSELPWWKRIFWRPSADLRTQTIARVHDAMITISGGLFLTAQFLLGLDFWRKPGWRVLSLFSLVGAPTSLGFLVASHVFPYHGLWQRLGFLVIFLWLLFVIRAVRRARCQT